MPHRFRRVRVQGHYRYQDARGRFVSRERVERARARERAAALSRPAKPTPPAKPTRPAKPTPPAKPTRPAKPTPPAKPAPQPVPVRVPAALPPAAPAWEPVAPPLDLRGTYSVRGVFVRYRDRRGKFVSEDTYQRMPPAQRRMVKREVHVKAGFGGSTKARPLYDALLWYLKEGIPLEGIPDDTLTAAVRLSLIVVPPQ